MENDQKIKSDAIRAGEKAIKSLKDAQKSLSKCQEKGMLDVLGPLSLSTSKKNAMLEDAKRCIKKAKDDLKGFGDKISEVLPDSTVIGLADKLFGNVNSFDKSRIERFYRQINAGIKDAEAVVRLLKKDI